MNKKLKTFLFTKFHYAWLYFSFNSILYLLAAYVCLPWSAFSYEELLSETNCNCNCNSDGTGKADGSHFLVHPVYKWIIDFSIQ